VSEKNLIPVGSPDDFDEIVADAIAVVEAGRARRLRVVEDDYLPPAVLFTRSRFRRAKLMDGLAVALLMLLMAALGVIAFTLAPHAKADVSPAVSDYVAVYGAGAVCPVLDEHHTVSGMLGVLRGIQHDGFTAFEAGQIVGMSVTEYCPRNTPLMRQFVAAVEGRQTA